MKTQFQGTIPVVPKDLIIPSAGFLTGDYAKEFQKEFKGRTEKDYPNTRGLVDMFGFFDKTLIGSSTFAAVLANQILVQSGLRTINQAEAETINDSLRGNYVDTGIVLRGTEEKSHDNYVAAEYLIKQLKNQNSKIKFPVVINLYDLSLENSSNSKYGLVFKLNEDAKPIYTKILDQKGKNTEFLSTDIDREIGLPKKLNEQGDRKLWTRASGLSGLCLDSDSNVNSNDGSLAGSNLYGRIVIVSAEGATSKKYLDDFVIKSQTRLQEEITNVKKECALKEQRLNEAYHNIMGN